MTSDSDQREMDPGVALDAYIVPKYGSASGLPGGSIPKAKKERGGMFAEVNRLAAVSPGPGMYHKENLDQSFGRESKGGKFSVPKKASGKIKLVVPDGGYYETADAKDKNSPRIHGGSIGKVERKCEFLGPGSRNASPAPGQYDVKKMESNLGSPSFSKATHSSKVPRKLAPLGPGSYSPSYEIIEKKAVTYSTSKQAASSFIDKIAKPKDTTPAPGHVDINTVNHSKAEDRSGRTAHSSRLLRDRQITPRGIDSAR